MSTRTTKTPAQRAQEAVDVLDRPEDILRAAFLDTVTDVAHRTERDVLSGTPTG